LQIYIKISNILMLPRLGSYSLITSLASSLLLLLEEPMMRMVMVKFSSMGWSWLRPI